jgi:peptidyl-prolyl cis-trans isomerase D
MFDFVRKHTKVMMFMMFLLIIPAFVLVGIDGYKRFNDSAGAVARVGGHDITQAEWDFAHKNEVERIRASSPTLDPKLLDTPQAHYATLERMVRERVMGDAADKAMLVTSDVRLARDLQQNPAIASLRRPDGSLDMERYRQLVASQGLTPEGFEARVRRDLSVRQVEAGVLTTAFAAPVVADVSLGAFFEKREVQFVNFSSADFAAKVTLTDAEVQTFYDTNKLLFQAPESVNIEYVVLDLDSIKKSISVNEQDVKSYYDQNVARLSGNEERRASHILINAPKDAPAAERQKAKAKAQELLAQVRKSPDQFAEIAKKNSQDKGSAANGGDLDFFARGAMVKPFEDAAFSMKKGDISDLVESDFGYHIIQLTDIRAPKQRSFEELRAGIESDLKTQQAQRKFAESAEAFTNGVYEQPDSLKPVADRLKLEIKTTNGVARTPAPGMTGILANAKLLTALFADDAIQKKRNTEAVETGPNQLVAGRVTAYAPARTLPLVDVRSAVREKLVALRSAELAHKEGQATLAAWKTKPPEVTTAAPVVMSREDPHGAPLKVLEEALRADPSSFPALAGVDLGSGGYAVIKVNKIVGRTAPNDTAATQARTQYVQVWAAAENQAYYQLLKERFKARITAPLANGANADAANTPAQ